MSQNNKLVLMSVTLLLLMHVVASRASDIDPDYEGPTAADTEVLKLINEYRTTVANILVLGYSKGAACVAHNVAFKFKDIVCSNETGADTQYGENPQIPDYLKLLEDCDVSLDNVKGGYIAPNCVPPGAGPSVAALNITLDQQYQTALNDSIYTTAGVGSSGSWYVLALATDQPDGNFGTTPSDLSGQVTLQTSLFTTVLLVLVASRLSAL